MELLNYVNTSELIGNDVSDTLGNSYGKVKDVLFSPKHGKAVMVIISTSSGFMSHENFVLPFQALRVNPNTKNLMVEIDKQTIQDAPLVDINLLQNGRKEEFIKIYNHYGYENVWDMGSDSAEPLHPSRTEGENAGERDPANEGSYEITKQYPGPKGSNIQEEADYDKIKGLPKNE